MSTEDALREIQKIIIQAEKDLMTAAHNGSFAGSISPETAKNVADQIRKALLK